VQVAVCDLSQLESVREFAGRFRDHVSRLDVLVNNAGVMTDEHALSADGIELTLATNVVGPFLLTNLLIPLLERSAPARIINVSSGGMYAQKITVDDLQSERGQSTGRRCTRAASARRSSSPRSGRSGLIPLAGRALDGKEYELPGDLAKQNNFLVVAFAASSNASSISGCRG
jgi:short chain dehydrogenase